MGLGHKDYFGYIRAFRLYVGKSREFRRNARTHERYWELTTFKMKICASDKLAVTGALEMEPSYVHEWIKSVMCHYWSQSSENGMMDSATCLRYLLEAMTNV